MPWTQPYESGLLKYFLGIGTVTVPPAFYLALSPNVYDPSGSWTELTQTNYARQLVTWNYGGDYFATNTAQLDFVNLGGGIINSQAIFTASTGGNMVFYNNLITTVNAVAGDTVSYKPGYLKVSF